MSVKGESKPCLGIPFSWRQGQHPDTEFERAEAVAVEALPPLATTEKVTTQAAEKVSPIPSFPGNSGSDAGCFSNFSAVVPADENPWIHHGEGTQTTSEFQSRGARRFVNGL